LAEKLERSQERISAISLSEIFPAKAGMCPLPFRRVPLDLRGLPDHCPRPMPILKGAATFSRYRVEVDSKSEKQGKKELAKALKLRAFEPLDPKGEDERSSGFVELENKNGTSFSAGALYEGEYALFAYRIDEVRVPAAAIRAEMDSWEQRFVAEHERPPVKKEKSEAKEELRFTLKTRYPVSSKTFEVSWHVEEGHAQIWAGSRKAVDEVQAAVEEALGVKLVPVAPLTIAGELGISEKALTPTAALSMDEEATNG
jgi:recombination associated protein RdgC